jgi:hypothetical protein
VAVVLLSLHETALQRERCWIGCSGIATAQEEVKRMMKMNILYLSAILLLATSATFGQDDHDPLRKVLAAFETAHRAHDLAQRTCSLESRSIFVGPPREGETVAINWGAIEVQTRELITKKNGAKPSEIIASVLPSLSMEREALLEDFAGCYPKQMASSKRVAEAMTSLNYLETELAQELWERVWSTEKGWEYLNQCCDRCQK